MNDRWRWAVIAIAFMAACAPRHEGPVPGNYAIAPLPAVMDTMPGHFIIDEHVLFQSDSFPDAGFDPLKVFREVFARKSGYPLPDAASRTTIAETDHLILILRSPVMNHPEGYRLRVTPFGIIINAAGANGVFYALQTLRQLMRMDAMADADGVRRSWSVPLADIRDEPVFAYRGLHLDVSRHMKPVAYIKRYIDQLAYYKMNRFHWHLTDDQGWRIEIKRFPKLQEIAAYRKETRVGHYSDHPVIYDGKRYGGYYTQDEIREVVAYAKDRAVTVIPEIEMPGHALAALSAYPELGCTGGPYAAATTWGVFDDVFCPKEETFDFLEGVLDEVMGLFPSTYIHIGGDECPKTRWKACPQCQARMKQEGLHDEHELQSYFIRRIEAYLNAKGRQIIGWDEIMEGGIAPNATIMSWRGTQGGIEAAKAGHDVIMTPGSPCYFDHYQAGPDGEPIAIGGFNTLRHVYAFNPVPAELSAEEAVHILGAQGNLWAEYIPDPAKADYMAYPRAIALAEVLWTPAARRDWDEFAQRLDRHRDRLDGMGVKYADHLRVPEARRALTDSGLQVIIATPLPRQTVYYSRDTTAGVWGNMLSGDTILLRESGPLFYKTEHSRTGMVDYRPSASAMATIGAVPAQSTYYPGANGIRTLADGLTGTRYHNGTDWCAWAGTPFVLTLTWPASIPVDTLMLGLLSAPGSWIYDPESIDVEGSADGTSFRPLARWTPGERLPGRADIVLAFEPAQLKAIRLSVRPLQRIPDGAVGAGEASWTFIDEITVR